MKQSHNIPLPLIIIDNTFNNIFNTEIMQATGFKLGNYTSSRTGEVSKKVAVVFDNGEELFLFPNKPEFINPETKKSKDIDEVVTQLKTDREGYLSQIIAATNTFGQKQAQFSALADAEEF